MSNRYLSKVIRWALSIAVVIGVTCGIYTVLAGELFEEFWPCFAVFICTAIFALPSARIIEAGEVEEQRYRNDLGYAGLIVTVITSVMLYIQIFDQGINETFIQAILTGITFSIGLAVINWQHDWPERYKNQQRVNLGVASVLTVTYTVLIWSELNATDMVFKIIHIISALGALNFILMLTHSAKLKMPQNKWFKGIVYGVDFAFVVTTGAVIYSIWLSNWSWLEFQVPAVGATLVLTMIFGATNLAHVSRKQESAVVKRVFQAVGLIGAGAVAWSSYITLSLILDWDAGDIGRHTASVYIVATFATITSALLYCHFSGKTNWFYLSLPVINLGYAGFLVYHVYHNNYDKLFDTASQIVALIFVGHSLAAIIWRQKSKNKKQQA